MSERGGKQESVLLEVRPQRLLAATYDTLPFPALNPVQEVAFDLGITALIEPIEVSGLVITAYHEHQLLVEQRWPAAVIRARTGEGDLGIEPGMGLAVRSLHLLLHGYLPLTQVDVTVLFRPRAGGETGSACIQLPVLHPVQQTDLRFPLRGAWWAIQGGDWSDQHKREVFSQPYALDFVKLGADSRFFAGSGLRLEDHHSWDEPVFAAAGGKVAYVGYDMPDLPPATPPDPRLFRDDPRRILGNAVAISHGNGEFSYYAHLRQASVQVNTGALVRAGTLLGRVGSSGHSPGPHLHFHLMEGPNLFVDQGLPVKFSHFEAGGQFYAQPTTIPTRMIVVGMGDQEKG